MLKHEIMLQSALLASTSRSCDWVILMVKLDLKVDLKSSTTMEMQRF